MSSRGFTPHLLSETHNGNVIDLQVMWWGVLNIGGFGGLQSAVVRGHVLASREHSERAYMLEVTSPTLG